VLLLRLPVAVRGEDLNHFLPYFTASLPGRARLQARVAVRFGLYQRSWQTFSLRDIAVVVRGVFMGSLLSVLAAAYFYRLEGFSRVVFIIDGLLLLIAIVATRASFRSMSLVAAARSNAQPPCARLRRRRVRSADRQRDAREP
jgi:FlaA1/EpsC-like NDP-sugar epimerase